MRIDKRENNALRKIDLNLGIQRDPLGSVEVHFGNTKVLIAVSESSSVPGWMAGRGGGWITAEYSMLPGSSNGRIARKKKGRSTEIERLIGRALRACVDLDKLGERLLTCDCDVIQADGGTRTASITGGFVALSIAIKKLMEFGKLKENPIVQQIASVSCGIVNGEVLLDLDYSEDSTAETDMNFVMNSEFDFIEIQGTAEKQKFSQDELNQMILFARKGISELVQYQRAAIDNK